MALLRRSTDCQSVISQCSPVKLSHCTFFKTKVDDILSSTIHTQLFVIPPQPELTLPIPLTDLTSEHTSLSKDLYSFSSTTSTKILSQTHQRQTKHPLAKTKQIQLTKLVPQDTRYMLGPEGSRTIHRFRPENTTRRFKYLLQVTTISRDLLSQIRKFEDDFMKVHHRKPRRREIHPIKKIVDEYKMIRMELQNCAAVLIQCAFRLFLSRKIAAKLRQERLFYFAHPNIVIQHRLARLRQIEERSADLNVLIHDVDQLLDEKSAVKEELRRFDRLFEGFHGRRPGKRDKEALKPLYSYYKKLSNILVAAENQPSMSLTMLDDSQTQEPD
ncbi:hypothetical protein BLNAU_2587 [Blattamonas nauphoetae]|uniref:FAM13A-like domain-containing protein n=1 Tax=Blattamonas nauphoetae TaxID=2049346 RepID=A0ABQ9YFI0_9EUKA|nr:hypothetical protein BLNAU_2587 [Blattamonas nauphoetae]